MQSNITMSDQNHITSGQWLAIKPTEKFWIQIQPIREIVHQQFNQISEWHPTELGKSHITLYMGIKTSLNKALQDELMVRIAQALENTNVFTNSIDSSEMEIRRLGKYLTLHFFNSDQLNALQTTVQNISKKFILDLGLEKNENWFDRQDFSPHITLGLIDVPQNAISSGPNRDERLTQFAKKGGKPWLDRLNQDLKSGRYGSNFTTRVSHVNLMGVNDSSLPIAEKKYYTLGSVKLNNNRSLPTQASSPINQPMPVIPQQVSLSRSEYEHQLKRILGTICKSSQMGAIIKKGTFIDRNSTENPCLNVTFVNKKDAEAVLAKANLGKKIFENRDGTFYIRLGIERMKALCGNVEGTNIFNQLAY